MKISILFALLCASLLSFKPAMQTLKTAQYAGLYYFGTDVEKGRVGSIIIYPETDSTVLFYIDLCRGAPSYNIGSLYDRLTIKDGEGIYFSDQNNYGGKKKTGCKWQVTFSKKMLTIKTIDDDYECGFGHAVYADNEYKRKDHIVHELFEDGEGRKIYFSKTTPEIYYK